MKKLVVTACLVVLAALSGCGGGSGGSGPPPTSSSATATSTPTTVAVINCPDGKTAATVSACADVAASVSPAQGAVVSSDGLQVTVTFTGKFDPATVTQSTVSLWVGTADVPGNAISLAAPVLSADGKSFTVALVAKAPYGQSYVGTVKGVTDSVGRPISVSDLSFSTTAMVCSGLTVWSNDYGTCVVPLGVQFVGVNQMQDATCTSDKWTWANACFITAVRNGTVTIAQSTATADGKPLIAAAFADATGANAILAFDVTDPKNPVPIGGNLLAGLAGALVDWGIPNPTFLLADLTVSSANGKYQFRWDTTSKAFVYTKL